LSDDDIPVIHETFRDQEIKGGLELDEAIEAIGIDPEILNTQPPRSSSDGNNERQKEIEGKPVKIYEVFSTEYGSSDFTLSNKAVENGELL
jgi:hypothetical protein